MNDDITFTSVGDCAVLAVCGTAIDEAVNARVMALDRAVRAAALSSVTETVPAYASLLVRYDPLLEVADAGERSFAQFAPGSDIAADIPRYRVYRKGVLCEETTDVTRYFEERDDLVSFLIGCSFSFESELLEAGVPVRQIEEGVNVPMYNTNLPCTPAGMFSGNLVVSMRPIPHALVPLAAAITAGMPRVHGMPVQIGAPEAIGIQDLSRPDYGDAVTIRPGEVPVFWPCGVTPQAVVMHSKPEFCITHAPGHMFLTDVKNVQLKF